MFLLAEHDVGYGFVINGPYYVKVYSLYSQVAETSLMALLLIQVRWV